ncbi:transposase [Draconibacterium sediminis]|uniref:transposase n=1 Tax=Draconibacterium sediminis TaxID=1544798 RepID=UPI000A4CF3D9|nr:transposase [Draconibacterium sediminis]
MRILKITTTNHRYRAPDASGHRVVFIKRKSNMYNPNIHNRRSIRLKNYDYSAAGLYFITLCTINREPIFGQIINGEMVYNAFGTIANNEWIKTPGIRKNISLCEFILMPNHFHAIISIDYKITEQGNDHIGKFQSPSQTIGAIIRGYKGATTKRINQLIREAREEKGSERTDAADTGERTGATDTGEATGVLQYAPNENAPSDALSEAPNEIAPSGAGSIWQRNYYESIIRSERAYRNISNYIINNPKNWNKDTLK